MSNFMKCYTYNLILGNLINWTYLTACCAKENKEITLFSKKLRYLLFPINTKRGVIWVF